MGVGKCVTRENPKPDLDLDLGFVKKKKNGERMNPMQYDQTVQKLDIAYFEKCLLDYCRSQQIIFR